MPKLKEGRIRYFNYNYYLIPTDKLKSFDESVESVKYNLSNAVLGGRIADVFGEHIFYLSNMSGLRVIIE